MKENQYHNMKHAIPTWIALTAEIIAAAILYAILGTFGVPDKTNILIVSIAAIIFVSIGLLTTYKLIPQKYIIRTVPSNQLLQPSGEELISKAPMPEPAIPRGRIRGALGLLLLMIIFVITIGPILFIRGGLPPTPGTQRLVNEADKQQQTFQQWITLMQQYKGDVTSYQKQYNDDKQALKNAYTEKAYNDILTTLSNQIRAIEVPALKAEANSLHQTLEDKVSAWRSQHTYHDDYDGQNYQYGYEYTDAVVVNYDLEAMSTAQTPKDFQQIIEDFNIYLTNFQAMTDNAKDTTSYNEIHKTDTQLMQKYGDTQGKVVFVSLYEQALRVYNNGQLVKAFLVTTGTPAHPSLPGTWWVEVKESPTVFKSFLQPGQPGYYPPTNINYAMQYHSDGYDLYDSWWRADYGPGTQFPHADSSGNQLAFEGSHGGVNIQEDNAHWLYDYVDLGTPVIIY